MDRMDAGIALGLWTLASFVLTSTGWGMGFLARLPEAVGVILVLPGFPVSWVLRVLA
jgi:hypothetical protein